MVLLLAILCLVTEDSRVSLNDAPFHRLIYEAEVHHKTEESLEKLRMLLADATEAEARQTIIRAMSIIKKSVASALRVPEGQSTQSFLLQTRAMILAPPFAFLYNQGSWLELGDWIEDYRIISVSFDNITLEDASGRRAAFSLPRLPQDEQVNANAGAILLDAPVGEILDFATRKESLNFFLPSSINVRLSGFFPETDWQSLIDSLCARSGLIWTRRLGSIVYERGNPQTNLSAMIRGIDKKNRLLGSLLEEIATTVGFDLVVFDENLREVAIDLYFEDQPWNEALDCLAITAGFNWAMVPQADGPGQIVVTRE